MDEDDMSYLMTPELVLARVVADEKAPVADRVTALKMLEHPALLMLRELLVVEMPNKRKRDPNRPMRKPVPAKLRSLAAIKYAREVRLRQGLKVKVGAETGNPLGV
jgi:hypothetical protein